METNHEIPSPLSAEQRIGSLEQQLAELRQQLLHSRASSARVLGFNARMLSAGVAGVVLLMTAGASSQGACPAGIPFCFQAGAVIRATEVNSNFAAVATSLGGKLGVSAQGDVNVPGTLGIKIKTKSCTVSAAGEVQCVCDSGEIAIGGGASAPTGAFLAASRPKASARDTWEVNCRKSDGTAATCADLRAVCAKVKAL
jgi:hypothetical protein